VPRLFLGAILGYCFYISGSIWVPIAAHAFNNTAQVILSYLYQKKWITYNIDNNEHTPLWLGLLSVLLSVLIIVWMLQRFKKNTLNPDSSNPVPDEHIS
jgi:membrane protease YdiL (CAAX protease family)